MFPFLILAFSLPLSTALYSSNCSNSFTNITQQKGTYNCQKLSSLGVEFAWQYHPENKTRIDVFVGVKALEEESLWLAWGVNPGKAPQMIGTQALIGIKLPNGTTFLNTYKLTNETKGLGCRLLPKDVDFTVSDHEAKYKDGGDEDGVGFFTISATVDLPLSYNIEKLNLVWQVGFHSYEVEPKMHSKRLENFDSIGTINLKHLQGSMPPHNWHYLRTVHGILNIVGWGTLVPIGAIIARYFRIGGGEPDRDCNQRKNNKRPVWFQLHITFQILGYILGVAGWSLGLRIAHKSTDYYFRIHNNLAMFIFSFSTLQMLSLIWRPRMNQPRQCKFWNMCHHFLGYGLIGTMCVNIFRGIDILRPKNTVWKRIYIIQLGILVIIVAVLEFRTWYKFIKWKQDQKELDILNKVIAELEAEITILLDYKKKREKANGNREPRQDGDGSSPITQEFELRGGTVHMGGLAQPNSM